jgi:tRNA-dihydrouridine synthase A
VISGLAEDWKLSVAPMMAWTDRHCRAVYRLLAPHARLYTEMVSSDALLHGPRERLLAHRANGQPLGLQLGGSDPDALAQCARIGSAAGFDEINLNVGCPSERVQRGTIGAVLMLDPARVRDCVKAMAEAATVPVTVKCRIGVDDHDDYEFLTRFASAVIDGGCQVLIVHARKALLNGLSPAQNRSIPPLDHARVHRLKRDFPELRVVINGGVSTPSECLEHLQHVDGVMLGRAVYQNPWLLADLEDELYGNPAPATRKPLLEAVCAYAEQELANGARLHDITRHLHGWFNGYPGARRFRRHLSEHAHRDGANPDVLRAATAMVYESPEVRCSIA